METVNKLFLAKVGWRIFVESSSFWLNLVKAKYLKGHNFMSLSTTRNDSWIWEGILKWRDILNLGACHNLGGNSVFNVWNEPWVPSMVNFKPQPRLDHLVAESWCVRDFILAFGTWDINLLKSAFSVSLEAILKIPISSWPNNNVGSWLYLSLEISRFKVLTRH